MGIKFKPRVRPSHVSSAVTGAVVIVVGGFTVAFLALLSAFFPLISSASGFFGSANVLMYLTVEVMFLLVMVWAGYMSLRHRL